MVVMEVGLDSVKNNIGSRADHDTKPRGGMEMDKNRARSVG